MTPARARSRPSVVVLAVRLLVVAAVFVLGLALGAALDEDAASDTTTYERTLRFATVTVTQP